MTKDLVWRMKELPSAGEVADLVSTKVITTEEARDILFKPESVKKDEDSEEIKALKEQIKFQQDFMDKLLEKLSNQSIGYWNVVTTYTPTYPVRYWVNGGAFSTTAGSNYLTMSANSSNVIEAKAGTTK